MITITADKLFLQESEKSAIPIELFRENAIALDGDDCLDRLFVGDIKRLNDGRVSWSVLKHYQHLKDGGIWFGGWSLDHGYDTPWGVLKPVTPTVAKDGKLKKYETPPKFEWDKIPVFLPKPDRELEQRIRQRFGNQNPELPWDKWLLQADCPIAIVEGSKKAMAILSTGLPAIGIYSLWSFANKTSKGKVLKPEISALLQNKTKAYFVLDNDTKNKQRRNAETALNQLATLTERSTPDCDFRIVDFSPLYEEKGIDDVFASILKAGHDKRLTLGHLIKRALKPIAWMQYRKANRSYKKNDYFVSSRYLQYEDLKPIVKGENKIVGIKSPKGTGKTELMKNLVSDNKAINKKTILITHRESLSRANAQRCGLPYWRDAIAVNRPHGFAMCIDSLRVDSELSFNASHYRGCDVVIDEVDQVLAHLLTSSTCRENRIAIFSELKDLVRECDRLFLLDADLSSNTLEFFEDLYRGKKTTLICNQYRDAAYQCHIDLSSDPSELVATALDHARAGGKLLILADSQKAKSKYSTSSLERLIAQNSPAKVLRIDSETLADPNSPAFGCLASLTYRVKDFDVVIASPSIGTGVSLDTYGYFDHVYGVFCGVLSPNSIRQFLLRLRDLNVPRSVFLPRLGLAQYGNGSDNPEALSLLQSRKWQATLNRYGVANVWDEEGDRLCTEFANAFYRIAALTNFEKYNFRELVIAGLEDEGCEILQFVPNHSFKKKEFIELATVNRDANYQAQIDLEIEARELTEQEFNCLEKHDSLTQEEQAMLRKFERKQTYGVDVTEQLIRLDDKRLYPQVKMLYYLAFEELATEKDKAVLEAQSDRKVFLPDTEKRLSKLKLELFKFLGLDKLIVDHSDKAETYCNDSDLIRDIAEKCRENASRIRDIFHCKINAEWTNIRLINHLLKRLVGLPLTYSYRTNYGGDRTRHYHSAVIPDLYHAIHLEWFDRDIEAIAQKTTL